MNISFNWLKKYIETTLSAEEIADQPTSVGLEVEEVRRYSTKPENLEGLVTGEVLETWPHPNADKLTLTKVNIEKGAPLQIVCGAPNVAAGQKVVVAVEGTTLHPVKGEKFTIKKSKIRGEESNGMICAEDEIGIGEDHSGIIVLPENTQVGVPYASLFDSYEDHIIEIGLTPNRGDAASHIGVARDLSAKLDVDLKVPQVLIVKSSKEKGEVAIDINDSDGCPRYSGLVIKGITVKESPDWLKNYLLAIGLHPINNIVDASNYVMYEFGQPLHTFDLAEIVQHHIIVRQAEKGESIVTLDKVERKLNGGELLITDPEKILALAGVFGGLHSGISEKTKDIFIESAWFNASAIRKTSKQFGLYTDASFRYERGSDPEITVIAAQRLADVITEIAGGEVEKFVYDVKENKIPERKIRFSLDRLDRFAGYTYTKGDVQEILIKLGFEIQEEGQEWLVTVPGYKTDVTREVDVFEEVMRIFSFDKIEFNKQVKSVLQVDHYRNKEGLKRKLSNYLIHQGGFEAYMLSFNSQGENEIFPERTPVKVLNPLSDEIAEMRNSLMVQGLKAVKHNINRQNPDVFLFSWGKVFQAEPQKEDSKLSIWITGSQKKSNWYEQSKRADIYQIKSIANGLLEVCETGNLELKEEDDKRYDTYIGMYSNSVKIGEFGSLQKKLLRGLGIESEVFYAEFNAEVLLKERKAQLQYEPYSKYPRVERDLALIVPTSMKYEEIKQLIYSSDRKLIKEISIFDVYQGNQVTEGFKSYAVRMTFEDKEKTLSDDIVDKSVKKIVYRLDKELGVQIRS